MFEKQKDGSFVVGVVTPAFRQATLTVKQESWGTWYASVQSSIDNKKTNINLEDAKNEVEAKTKSIARAVAMGCSIQKKRK